MKKYDDVVVFELKDSEIRSVYGWSAAEVVERCGLKQLFMILRGCCRVLTISLNEDHNEKAFGRERHCTLAALVV